MIKFNKRTLREKEGYISALEKLVRDKENIIANLEKSVQARDNKIFALKKQLQKIEDSVPLPIRSANKKESIPSTDKSTQKKGKKRCSFNDIKLATAPGSGDIEKSSILVIGIYFANQENTIEHIVYQLNQSKNYQVKQKWVVLCGDPPTDNIKKVTIFKLTNVLPKFVLLNQILSKEKLDIYDYLVICDDDIKLCNNFIDNFLDLQRQYDFALAQPARTHNSFIDHPFVEQFKGLKARRTRYVEIGPLISMRKDTFLTFLPFDERCPMGWGYDFVWPLLIEKMKLRMGIVDATPVDHSIRKPVTNYNYHEANKSMADYLLRNSHLSKDEAFRILESYA